MVFCAYGVLGAYRYHFGIASRAFPETPFGRFRFGFRVYLVGVCVLWNHRVECQLLKKTKQLENQKKPPPQYVEGHAARENFEKTMTALFRAPKSNSKKHKKGKD
jgi:hypothetical protein